MTDDFVLNVRQITAVPAADQVLVNDGFLFQRSGFGGPYCFATIRTMLNTGARSRAASSTLAPGGIGGIAFNGATLTFATVGYSISPSRSEAPQFFTINGAAFGLPPRSQPSKMPISVLHTVSSFNGRVWPGACWRSATFCRAGGRADPQSAFARLGHQHRAVQPRCRTTCRLPPVTGCITRSSTTRCFRCRQLQGPARQHPADRRRYDVRLHRPGAQPHTATPPSGDTSTRIANTAFVDDGLVDLQIYVDQQLAGLPSAAGWRCSRRSTVRISPAFRPRPTANPGTDHRPARHHRLHVPAPSPPRPPA